MANTGIPWLNPDDLLRLKYCPRCDYCLRGLPARHQCPECGFEYDEQMFDLYGWTTPPFRWMSPLRNIKLFSISLLHIILLTIPFLGFLMILLMVKASFAIEYFRLGQLILLLASMIIGILLIRRFFYRRSERRPPVTFIFTDKGYGIMWRPGLFSIMPWSYQTCLDMYQPDRFRTVISVITEITKPISLANGINGILELDTESFRIIEAEIRRRITMAAKLEFSINNPPPGIVRTNI